jgi:DNA (cytosine-5)-methyltransferase 1
MKYGSICSGIEAATVAWEPLGWKAAWYSEIEKFPCQLLKYHYPTIPNLGDMTKLNENEIFKNTEIDLIIGGTPCQDFSLAGQRAGMAGDKGQLTLEFCKILREKQPRWFVWENVAGALSSNKGRDFIAILSEMQKCGYGLAYRILDAQYFGVPQRRRRVFVVGYLGDWRPAAEVLFEQGLLQRNPKSSSKSGTNKQHTGNEKDGKNFQDETGCSRGDGVCSQQLTSTLKTRPMRNNVEDVRESANKLVCQTLRAGPPFDGSHNQIKNVVADTITIQSQFAGIEEGHNNLVANTLSSNWQSHNDGTKNLVSDTYRNMTIPESQDTVKTVRRFLPIECERLMGFEDGYSNIPGAKDTARYKALGNSMAVPVVRWIGERIQEVEDRREK